MRLSRVTLDGDSDNSRKRKFSMSGHDEARPLVNGPSMSRWVGRMIVT
jgi:hypothetical protein